MTPVPTPHVRYQLMLTYPGGKVPCVLDQEEVLGWVSGFAACLGEQDKLEAIEPGPEDTRRVQALLIGDANGWFEYLKPEYPDKAEG